MKKIAVMIIMITTLLCISGCKEDEVIECKSITGDSFAQVMEAKGLEVADSEVEENSGFDVIKIAVKEDAYTFEYYDMTDEESAQMLFDWAKGDLSSAYLNEDGTITDQNSQEGYDTYSIMCSDGTFIITRWGETVIYMKAVEEFEEEARDILESIN